MICEVMGTYFKGKAIGVCGRSTLGQPERVCEGIRSVFTHARKWTPELICVFLEPGVDTSVAHGSIDEGEQTYELGVVRLVIEILSGPLVD